MTDLRLAQTVTDDFQAVTLDLLQMSSGLPDETRELETAVIVALGTDARANADDELPVIAVDDRRGWWGDLDAEEIWSAWPIGSRLWLLERAKITGAAARQGATLARAESYVREALQPFVDSGIASKLSVVAARTALGKIEVAVIIYRGPLAEIALKFQPLWSEIAA